MLRSVVLSLLTFMLAASPGLGEEGSYQGVFFSTPPGWSSGEQEGRFLLAPDDITEQTAVVVVLYGAEKLGGKSFNDWFRDRMASDLHPQAKVLSDGEIKSTNVGGLQMLTTARAVQDAEGGVRIQMYHAVSDGRQAALAMGVTASEEAINKYSGGIQALFGSLRFSASAEPGANPSPSSTSSSAPPAGDRQVRVADLVGYWTHSTASTASYVHSSTGAYAGSSTIAYGQGFTFKADQTYTYRFKGMWNSVYVDESDSGTFAFANGLLVLKGKQRGEQRFQIIGWEDFPDGSASVTLLSDYYPPTEGNIGLYGEKLVRAPAKPSDAKK